MKCLQMKAQLRMRDALVLRRASSPPHAAVAALTYANERPLVRDRSRQHVGPTLWASTAYSLHTFTVHSGVISSSVSRLSVAEFHPAVSAICANEFNLFRWKIGDSCAVHGGCTTNTLSGLGSRLTVLAWEHGKSAPVEWRANSARRILVRCC